MIKRELIRRKWIRTYSDESKYIANVDDPETFYVEAVDPIDNDREYFETDIDIEYESE